MLSTMYSEYFGLNDSPFSIAPDPKYLYMSERHREALAHLLYGIRGDGGFILITGEVGTGKTTVCRCLLEQMPDDIDTAFILNPKLTAHELLATICDDLGVNYPHIASIKGLVDRLSEFLLNSHNHGRKTVLIIDEAQNLSIEVLEQLRLLTNLETNQRKLLQIILLGQPELLRSLSRQELRQLSQRIIARFHLDVLNREEVQAYIVHRLSIAGAQRELITPSATRRIVKLSGGAPRMINLLCDRALLGAWVEGRHKVNKRIVNKAARETLGENRRAQHMWPVAATAAALILLAGGVTLYYDSSRPPPASLAAETSPSGIDAESAPAEVDTTGTDPPHVTATMTSAGSNQSSPGETAPIADINGYSRRELAFADLFSLWQVPLSDGAGDPCTLAAETRLRCLDKLGSLRDIEHLNRPVVLRLSLGNRDHWFTLVGLEENHARIIAADRSFLITRQRLLSNWDGRYTVLWQTPPNYTRPVQQGDDGEVVDWLVARLDDVDGRETITDPGYKFDRTLTRRVKRFQLAAGLNPDGIAGPQTWIHLNSRQGEEVPLLKPDSRR